MKPARPLLPLTLTSSQATVSQASVLSSMVPARMSGREGLAHHELSLALVAAANVAADVDVALAGQLGTSAEKRGAVGPVASVGRALDEEWQRCGDVRRLQINQVQLDAVAHGDHGFGTLVVVEEVTNGRASAAIGVVRRVGKDHALDLAGIIERKAKSELRFRH